MTHRPLLLLAGLVLLPWSAMAQPSDVSVDDLEALVGRWMELRAAIADEKRDWQAREEQWGQEIRLLEAEKKKLSKDLEASNRFASSVEQDRVATLARKEAMETVLEYLHPLLDRAESCLRAWEPLIPTPLSEGIAKGFAGLPATRDHAQKRALTERAQRIAALYTQIESLHHGFHATQEILDTGTDQRRLVDVLYAGLARGFAVATDDRWAAVGTPTDLGWAWQARPEIAPSVREAVEVLNRQRMARLVDLPIQVLDDTPKSSPSGADVTGGEVNP